MRPGLAWLNAESLAWMAKPPSKETSEPAPPTSRVFPMEFRGEREVVGPPYTAAGGKLAHARVQRVGAWCICSACDRCASKGEHRMIRRHRGFATLFVTLYLLISAATAYAECAWVLWSASDGASLPVSAWDAKSRCEEAKNERLRALSTTVERKDVTFVCLPDTVDPRGPKGK